MRLYNIIIVLTFGILHAFSQDIQTTEVKVLENFVPAIPQADRLNENAIFSDTSKLDKKQQFKIFHVDLGSDYQVRPLKPAKIKNNKIDQLYKTRVSLGSGYRVASELSLVYNSIYSKDISSAIIFNHFRNNAKVDNKYAGRSSDGFYAYLKKIKNNKKYVASLDYDRLALFSYGIGVSDKRDFNNSITKNNPFLNRFSYSKIFFSIQNSLLDREELIRDVNFFISDLNEFAENQIHLSTSIYKRLDTLPISFLVEYNNYLNYYNKGNVFESTSIHSINLLPSTSVNKYGCKIHLSLPINFVSDGSPLKFFPQLKIEKELVRDILFVNGGLRHINYRNTFKSLYTVNPYIHSYGTNQSVIQDGLIEQKFFTTYIDEIYFSMSNFLSKEDHINLTFSYGKVDNFPYFVLIDNGYYKRFGIRYIESLMQSHIRANYTKDINDFFMVSCLVDYYSRNQSIDHTEDILFDIESQISLRDKIYVTPSLSYQGKRNSLQKELAPLFYMNIRLEYNYSKQLSSYLYFNNLTNSKNEIWDSYKDIGFNAVFGLKYAF